MSVSHTPGPWVARLARWTDGAPVAGFGIYAAAANRDDKECPLANCNVSSQWVAAAFFSPDEMEANARLIAAAPELLAIMKEACDHSDKLKEENGSTRTPEGELAYQRARAAINKAEGKTP